MENPKKDKVIPVPDYTLPPLSLVEKTGSIIGHNGVTFIAGEGIKPADIMFISSCVSPQEASKFIKGKYNEEGVRVRPRYLRSDAGVMFSDIFNQEGIDLYKCYYTALVKWLLPKNERIKIPKDVIAWALPALEAEIQSVNPKIIVCIGKPVFDLLTEIKLSLSDAKSGWFYNKKYNAKLYLIDDTYKLVTNPEYIGKFRVEAREIHRMHREVCNLATDRIPLEYETITNSADLKRVVSNWKQNNFNVISVDCEWAGNNHIDGQLRSTQFCWAPGKACYVRWMDDKGNYTFDTSYKEAGSILSSWLDREEVKYIGHHFAADAPWLHHVLGLNWYEKCIFDTEFAQQTANEAEDLSLERIALKYTDLGRYDLDLVLWVKQNKALMVDGGYGAIPDDILIPYACKDVDTVFRAWPFIHRSLQIQDLLDYYNNVFHPFVTDVFVSFAVVGLPMDVAMMDELRVLYTFARDKMEVVLREDIHVEAKNFILMAFATRLPPELAANSYLEFISLIANSDHAQAWSILKSAAKKPDDVPKLKFIFDHFIDSSNFNIRSAAHLKRWLFQVKGYEPIKSTNNKDKGLPATSWEKIKAMPLDVQKNYNPAVDKQTLQILSEQNDDRILRKLLQLNAVGNICKAFLKEADTDADGNVLKENGLHFYLCSDNRVHGQMSTTETGRPRSWKPNSLNWPSYVNSMISSGISDLFGKLKERDELPEEFEKFIIKDDKGDYKIKVPSIRSCVKAPDDWCFVESDYQTAEIRGLAFISGDKNLIDIVCNPDLNFAVTKDDKKVRLSFPSEVFPPSAQEEYKSLLISPDDPSLMRKEDGSLKHPKQDLHWSLAEMVHIKPREVLDDKKDRGAAKVGNFSCIAKDSYLHTPSGPKLVTNISLDDMLWDGVEWVSHEGIQYQGNRCTIRYQGLAATPDHVIWLANGNKCCFGDAAINGWKIKEEQTLPMCRPQSQNAKSPLSRNDSALLQRHARIFCKLQRPGNRSIIHFPGRFCTMGFRPVAEYKLQRFGFRPYRQFRALLERKSEARNAPDELEKYKSIKVVFSHTRRSHNNCLSRFTSSDEDYLEYAANGHNRKRDIRESKVRRNKEPEGYIIQRESITSQEINTIESEPGCRRETDNEIISERINRSGYSSTCGQAQRVNFAYSESYATRRARFTTCRPFRHRLCRQHYKENDTRGIIRRTADSSLGKSIFKVRISQAEDREAWLKTQRRYYSQVDEAGNVGCAVRRIFEEKGFKLTKEPVYDIINAGPRRRFVANGLLVSNSAYGASASTLERKIEQDTGKKPEEGTGQRLLKALEKRQPVAQDFLIKMERVPEKPGYYRAASGRLRHFSSHDPKLFRSMGREARNFPMQESVAATAARAGKWLLDAYIKLGMQARPLIILYDSVVTLCPLEERFKVAQLHQLFMTDENTWTYHGRTMNYPIDQLFCYRWSDKPSKDETKLLEDKTYKTN